MKNTLLLASFFLALSGIHCTKDEPKISSPPPTSANANPANPGVTEGTKTESQPLSQEELIKKGKSVYNSVCTACHAMDPRRDGSIGPAIYGSSKELIQARVLEAKYPAGYKPKRSTQAMPPFAHLKKDIDALHAFLNAP